MRICENRHNAQNISKFTFADSFADSVRRNYICEKLTPKNI